MPSDRRSRALIVRPRGTQRILRPPERRDNPASQLAGGSRPFLNIGSGMARGGGVGAQQAVAAALAGAMAPSEPPPVFSGQPVSPFAPAPPPAVAPPPAPPATYSGVWGTPGFGKPILMPEAANFGLAPVPEAPFVGPAPGEQFTPPRGADVFPTPVGKGEPVPMPFFGPDPGDRFSGPRRGDEFDAPGRGDRMPTGPRRRRF